jgi:hypothetical protein
VRYEAQPSGPPGHARHRVRRAAGEPAGDVALSGAEVLGGRGDHGTGDPASVALAVDLGATSRVDYGSTQDTSQHAGLASTHSEPPSARSAARGLAFSLGDGALKKLTASDVAAELEIDLRPCTGRESGSYVYLLADPRSGEVFYVGKGSGRRYRAHAKEARAPRPTNVRKCQRIRAIEADGLSVEAWCVGDGITAAEALELERALIAWLKGQLTNVTSGCVTERARAADMFARLLLFDEWRQRRPRSPRDVDLYWKISAGLFEVAVRRG